MSTPLSPIDAAKYAAARHACDLVEDGMRVGLGTGSTAVWMVRRLAELVTENGWTLDCVPTSTRTARLARDLGLNVVDLGDVRRLDLTIDGADEVDGALNLIKGGGGALLQEKIVATASDRMVVIADPSKHVQTLGAFPLPVEIVTFGWQSTLAQIDGVLESQDVLGTAGGVRKDGDTPFVTDNGNLIADFHLKRIGDAGRLAAALTGIPGVVDSGLFVDICDAAVIGHGDGRVDVLDINGIATTVGRVEIAGSDNLFSPQKT